MRILRTVLAATTLATTTLLGSGCQSLVFAVANRGLDPPEASVVYADDKQLVLDIYRPPRDNKPAPVVVFFYGGTWQQGERAHYRFVGQRLAQNGVLTILPNYRTWPEVGFPAFVKDAAQAVAWAREHADEYGGDPQRLFIAGHSAGAQIAALLGADPHYLAEVGMAAGQLDGVIGLSGPYDFAISGKLVPIFGAPSQWPQAQVIGQVDGSEPPFLLIHGSDDHRVETRDSVELARKLRRHGVPAQLVLMPDGGHGAPLWGFYSPEREPAVLPAILQFVGLPDATTPP